MEKSISYAHPKIFVPLPFRKDSDTTHRRYPHGETYPAWFEIDQIAEALGEGTKLSFHLNETEDYRDLVTVLGEIWAIFLQNCPVK